MKAERKILMKGVIYNLLAVICFVLMYIAYCSLGTRNPNMFSLEIGLLGAGFRK